ncbi:hypothetical protein P9314_16810 [Paenibacillus validus]|uniref:Uncharacterized protein n=1 Tax=Paenibacillus validus TaxID=44253 RepID=A0A7X2Z676_9BACL|nr:MULTISPECIES: hypothetical protein [Paenibacillus]MED4602329.1 hypothetical protein [Paenibacillus validus]MED4607638.1 hypothetical protein [Paenibacillus validus]MUG69066.1 hypothetical protein [Paenibacillus validus]
MLNLFELANLHPDIEAVHEVVQALKARIDGKEVGIKILKNEAGHYFYELSHYYRGADNANPYVSTDNRFASVEEAARGALRSATMFYRSTDEGGTWLKNESFYP